MGIGPLVGLAPIRHSISRHLADPAVADQLGGQAELAAHLGALLAAGLEDLAGRADGLDQGLGLGDGQRQRLLAVDVLAALQRLDGHQGVPVVGSGDGDGVDVLVFEQFAVVGVALGV